MDGLILANKNGKEIRELSFDSYDFEVGENNSFQVKIRRQDYETIPDGSRIYLPGTEFGGLFRELTTNTELDVICPAGLTWRGMMRYKIIEPPSGSDYATDSGELNAIIKSRVEAAFPDMFVGSDESTGVAVSGYQYERYVSLEEGLTAMLATVGYKLNIEYSQPLKAVVVSAVPVVDYSESLELSSDMQANYVMEMQGDGVNHLICLGQGELRNRTVVHLYVGENEEITETPYYTGPDEVAAVYDNPGASTSDLKTQGTARLKQLMNKNTFEMQVDPSFDVAVGDIVGGRDYLSGMRMLSPVTGKILRWRDGFREVEYRLGDGTAVYDVSWVYIKTQPVNVIGELNAYVYLTLEAVNAESYQWYYYNPNNQQWRVTTYTGAQTDTLRVRLTTTNNNYLWRCVVTGEDGSTVTSNSVTAIGT